MQVFGTGKSDVGKVRANNEDTIYVNNEGLGNLPNLFIVADGMGGHNAGEVASAGAVEAFCNHLREISDTINNDADSIMDLLTQCLELANRNVHGDAQNTPDHAGMGTTFTACVINEDRLIYAHVGDSRVYLFHDNTDSGFDNGEPIVQLTRDHTLVADMVDAGSVTPDDARCHPNKNILTRAVGTDTGVIIDSGIVSLENVKYVLMCTDGLTDMLDDTVMREIITTDSSISEKIDTMIAKALDAGGDDNISVILIGGVTNDS